MHGKSVSPLIRVRKPTLSVWYQMFSSERYGVSPAEMKSTTSWVTSTTYSFAPMPSKAGISKLGSSGLPTERPRPEWAEPVTAPWALAQRGVGRSQAARSRDRVVPAAEEALLVVIAGPPGEHRAHVERLAFDLSPHVLGRHALGGVVVVRAARRVDVVVPRIPSELRGIDPS